MDLSEVISQLPDDQASAFKEEFRLLKKSLPEIGDAPLADLKDSFIVMSCTYAGDDDRIDLLKATLLLLETDDVRPLPEYTSLLTVLQLLMRRKLELDSALVSRLLGFVAGSEPLDVARLPIAGILGAVERQTLVGGVPPEWSALLRTLQSRLRQGGAPAKNSTATLIARIEKLCKGNFLAHLKSDDGWADQMAREIDAFNSPVREQWETLVQHAATVTPEPPATDWDVSVEEFGPFVEQGQFAEARLNRTCNSSWDTRAQSLIQAIGRDDFRQTVTRWLESVPDSKPGTLSQFSINREILRGLLWCIRDCNLPKTMSAISAATEFFFRKNSPLGVTGVAILERVGTTEALMHLTVLEGRLKADSQKLLVRTARKRLAAGQNISFDDLDDLTIPTSGFNELGRRMETLAGFKAELTISGRSARLAWFKPNGNPQASIPAAVKREHPDELKDLQRSAKAVETTLSTSIARFEAARLSQRSWNVGHWKSRYLNHPVVGTIVRRLIWQIVESGRRDVVAWNDDQFVNVQGNPVNADESACIELWHPIDDLTDDILAWRQWLGTREITQPFKQAHREVYLLTDAERNTRVYSNRFASHILKQSQYRVLAKSRGWTSDYLGGWDSGDNGVAKLALPKWNLQVEFWVSAASEEIAEGSGGYLYVATDQVRFYRLDATDQPFNLSDVPPLVLSEVLRDVDLFVGVSSVGNDPNWQDGGPDGRYRDYWQNYSFGELSETAKTRKSVLETLIPRLCIADRCGFVDHFLVVRGDLRTYKIHLGSANILMEPDDQYLCIVSARNAAENSQPMFLPFDGDRIQ